MELLLTGLSKSARCSIDGTVNALVCRINIQNSSKLFCLIVPDTL